MTSTNPIPPGDWRERAAVLVDPEGDNQWSLQGVIDLSRADNLEGPLVQLQRIGV